MRRTVAQTFFLLAAAVALGSSLGADQQASVGTPAPVPLQPLAQQARRLETTLRYLGEPLADAEREALDAAIGLKDEAAAVAGIQQVFDPRVLITVHISPESRVRVEQAAARPQLVQGGTRLFLVKVLNDARVTAPLALQSPNIGNVFVPTSNSPEPKKVLTDAQVRDRWADMSFYTQPPMRPRLSGLAIEYAILQISSRDTGQRSALIGINVGQGSQDVGFRNDVEILFDARPSHPVMVRVKDKHGRPTTAGFLIKDRLDRI